jgi:hypothetical protein
MHYRRLCLAATAIVLWPALSINCAVGFDNPGACNPAENGSCAQTVAPNHQHAAPAPKERCCGSCLHHLWLLSPAEPPTGIVVQSMPFLNAQVVTQTTAAPVQLTGSPLKFAPTQTGSKPPSRVGACSPENSGDQSTGAGASANGAESGQFATQVQAISEQIRLLQANLTNRADQQAEQVEALKRYVDEKTKNKNQ